MRVRVAKDMSKTPPETHRRPALVDQVCRAKVRPRIQRCALESEAPAGVAVFERPYQLTIFAFACADVLMSAKHARAQSNLGMALWHARRVPAFRTVRHKWQVCAHGVGRACPVTLRRGRGLRQDQSEQAQRDHSLVSVAQRPLVNACTAA